MNISRDETVNNVQTKKSLRIEKNKSKSPDPKARFSTQPRESAVKNGWVKTDMKHSKHSKKITIY